MAILEETNQGSTQKFRNYLTEPDNKKHSYEYIFAKIYRK